MDIFYFIFYGSLNFRVCRALPPARCSDDGGAEWWPALGSCLRLSLGFSLAASTAVWGGAFSLAALTVVA